MTEKTRGAMAGWFGHSAPPTLFRFERRLALPELQQHKPQEGVSLAYEQGLFYTVAHTRLRAVAVGGRGPGLTIGKATTREFHQSVLSKRLSPPVKWSYRKLILWWAVVSFAIGWILFYINSFLKHSSAVLSPPLILFLRLSVAIFVLLLVSSGGTIRSPTNLAIPSGNARSFASAVAV